MELLNKLLAVFLVLVILSSFTIVNPVAGDISEICLSKEEKSLLDHINQYRKQRSLPSIKLSRSLTFVAKQHAYDLASNVVLTERCNMHSWSGKGKWISCCYTSNHEEAECMWNKPGELTDYPGHGYEIVFYSNREYVSVGDYSTDVLDSWSKSNGHNTVILNLDVWKQINWKSIGIGIYEGYATVWFGAEDDPEGAVGVCP